MVELGRAARAEARVRTRQPLSRALIGARGWETLPADLRAHIADELNVSELTTLADGGVFDLTDIRVENPYNDRGIATLLVNSEPLFIWSLENIRGSFFEPRITPIRLDPGDNVTFSVKCDEIGDAGRSGRGDGSSAPPCRPRRSPWHVRSPWR